MKRLDEKALGAAPEDIDRVLRSFSRAARLLSSKSPRLIDEHPKEWIGVFNNDVCVSDKTLDGLIQKLNDQGIKPKDAIIRFIEVNRRKMIL
jgi:hypothetical protein